MCVDYYCPFQEMSGIRAVFSRFTTFGARMSSQSSAVMTVSRSMGTKASVDGIPVEVSGF